LATIILLCARLVSIARACGAPLVSFYRFAFGLDAPPQRIHGADDLRWLPTFANVA
jgi:hypothetical protein